jgi:hypothetical protein
MDLPPESVPKVELRVIGGARNIFMTWANTESLKPVEKKRQETLLDPSIIWPLAKHF